MADNQNQQAREVNNNQDQNVNPDPVQAQDRQGKTSIDRRYLNIIIYPISCMSLLIAAEQIVPEANAAGTADTPGPVDALAADNWELTEDDWAAISAEVARLGY